MIDYWLLEGKITYMSCVDFLNRNSGSIQAMMAVLLVVLTAYYARQTRKTVQTMKEIEDEKNRPRMLIYVQQREDWINMVYLVISNVGLGLAHNVSFIVRDYPELNDEPELSERPFLKNGYKAFPPERTIKTYIAGTSESLKRLQETNPEILVQYTDSSGKRDFSESFSLDFNSLDDRQLSYPPENVTARSLEKISVTLSRIEGKMK